MTRTELSMICSIFVLSLLLRLVIVIPTHFDGLYGQDAYAYYDYTQSLKSSLQTATTLRPFFWPLGYPALLAVAFGIGGTSPSVAQAVSLLMGAALSPLVYLIARKIGVSRFGGVASASIMTVCGQALQSSIVIMSDIPALFWATLSALLLIYYLKSASPHQTKWLILAAVLLVLAAITRWIYLLLGLPFNLAVLLAWRGHIRRRPTLITFIVAGLALLPQILYSRTNPNPTLDHAWVEGWSPANAFERSFTNIDGHFDYAQINAVYYAQSYYDPNYLSPLFSIFIVIGLWTLARGSTWQFVLLGGWALLPYLFLAGIPYQNLRFPLIVVPAVAIITGIGIDTALTWLPKIRIRQTHFTQARWIMVFIILLGLWQMLSSANTLVTVFINNQQRDKQAAAWVGESVPAGSTIYTFGLTLTLRHYTSLDVRELYDETPQSLANTLQLGHEAYLVLNLWNIENQWAGRNPQLDYHWLRDQRGLQQLGKSGYYTLFKIKG